MCESYFVYTLCVHACVCECVCVCMCACACARARMCMCVYFASMMLDARSITYRRRRDQGNPTKDSTFSSRLASCTTVRCEGRRREEKGGVKK